MNKTKFDYYEVVRVCTDDTELEEIKEKEAIVLGIDQTDEGEWSYCIGIIDEDAWCVMEKDLVSLGRFAKKEDIYTGDSMTVGVNEKGEGYIKDYKIDEE